MKMLFKKILVAGALLAVFGVSFSFSGARAAESDAPQIKLQKNRENSAVLKVTYPALKSTKVILKAEVTNKDDNSTSNKTIAASLGKNGTANIKIGDLESSTNYSIKVRAKKKGTGFSYSSYSNSVVFETKGLDYSVKIEKIKSVTEDGLKLEINSDDLENESVNVQVAYKKKSSWTKKNFDLTLDGDGDGEISISGLKSGTQYSFKIRIKKTSDSTYSGYSSIKSVTTDED